MSAIKTTKFIGYFPVDIGTYLCAVDDKHDIYVVVGADVTNNAIEQSGGRYKCLQLHSGELKDIDGCYINKHYVNGDDTICKYMQMLPGSKFEITV